MTNIAQINRRAASTRRAFAEIAGVVSETRRSQTEMRRRCSTLNL